MNECDEGNEKEPNQKMKKKAERRNGIELNKQKQQQQQHSTESIGKTNTVDLVKRRKRRVCEFMCVCALYTYIHVDKMTRTAQIEHRFWAVE